MTGEQQKQRAKELLQAADRGDAAAVDAMISEDFTLELTLRVPITLSTGEPLQTVFDRKAYRGFARNRAPTR